LKNPDKRRHATRNGIDEIDRQRSQETNTSVTPVERFHLIGENNARNG